MGRIFWEVVVVSRRPCRGRDHAHPQGRSLPLPPSVLWEAKPGHPR
jgi:hypothetical protein